MPAAAPAPLGRREARKLRTRAALLAAARELLAEQGAAELRIGDVTARAGVGFGTLYTYFPSKDALLEAVVADVLARVAAASTPDLDDPEADPAVIAAAAFGRFVALASEQPEVARALVALPDAQRLLEEAAGPQARATLERGVASGRFAVGDVELAFAMLAGAALAAVRAALAGRLGPGADARGAEHVLRALGLQAAEAARLAGTGEPA